MSSRLDAIPRKKGGIQPSFQRGKKLCALALVPKSGRKSDDGKSSDSEDEIQQAAAAPVKLRDDDEYYSSPAPSLSSSLENLNLLSDEDVIDETAATIPSVNISSKCQSPNSIPPSPLATFSNTSIQTRTLRVRAQRLPTATTSTAAPSLVIPATPSSSVASPRPRFVISRIHRPVRREPLQYHWSRGKFMHCAEITEKVFPEVDKVLSPYDYFNQFLTDDLLDYTTEQTNLYFFQETGKCLNVTKNDIKDFLGIILFMGIVDMPAYTDYWSREFRYSPIADVMSLKKFQQIRRYIHFNNNVLDDGDRYFKIRPLIQQIRQNFLKVPHENRFSIDEMMVPYKGKKAGNRRQYVKNKPRKWGYKIFVRAGVSGFVYDFIVYGGEDTFRYDPLPAEESNFGLGAKIVLALCNSIPDPKCSVVYFDNFFTSLELIHYLREEKGIFSLGTIRSNRLRGAENKLISDKLLKKKPRGSHCQTVCNSNKICVVKWYDNKCVTTARSYVEATPLSTIERYDKETKTKSNVPCPQIIKHYNAHMGGVDLADMLIALYRTEFKGHRWYLPLVSQIIDMCVSNSWILYRRHSKAKKYMSLKKFRFAIIQSLLKRDRHSEIDDEEAPGPTPSKIIKEPKKARPAEDVRYDQTGHFPVFGTKGRCKLCINGQTTVACSKCLLRLCLLPNRNCFVTFHSQE